MRRYERGRPGELIHVDIKKLGNIPDGGGAQGQRQGPGRRQQLRIPRPHAPTRHGRPNLGYSYPHNAVDDHSRLAFSEILTNEKKETATGFWHRAGQPDAPSLSHRPRHHA